MSTHSVQLSYARVRIAGLARAGRESLVMDLYAVFRKAAALIAATACTVSAHAQDGAYDPSFGDVSIPGRTWIDVSPSPLDDATKLIQLPGGNLFMAGSCGVYTCAAWLTPSGNKISGFGNNTHLGTS